MGRVLITGAVLFSIAGALCGAIAGLGLFVAIALKALALAVLS